MISTEFGPSAIEINSLGIGLEHSCNIDQLDLSNSEYLVVGQKYSKTGDTQDIVYNLLVNNDSVGINTTRRELNTMNQNSAKSSSLYVGSDIICSGNVIANGLQFANIKLDGFNSNVLEDLVSSISSITPVFYSGYTKVKNVFSGTSDDTLSVDTILIDNQFTTSFITIGTNVDTINNSYPLNIASTTNYNVENIHINLTNKSTNKETNNIASLRMGIIGDYYESPAVISTTKGMPLTFHVGIDTEQINSLYKNRTIKPVYANEPDITPSLTLDTYGNVAIGLDETNEITYFDITEKKMHPKLQVSGGSVFDDIVVYDNYSKSHAHLDNIYIRKLGKTFTTNQIIPGDFEPGEFVFHSNVYIGEIGDQFVLEVNNKLCVYGNLDVENNTNLNVLNVNNQATFNHATQFLESVHMQDTYIEGDMNVNGDLKIDNVRILIQDLHPIMVPVEVAHSYDIQGSNVLVYANNNTLNLSAGSNLAVPGRLGAGVLKNDNYNEQFNVIKHEPLCFEMLLQDSSYDSTDIPQVYIGHIQGLEKINEIVDKSILFNTNSINGLHNFYFYPGVDFNRKNMKNIVPVLAIHQNQKVGIKTNVPRTELDINGDITCKNIFIDSDNSTNKGLFFISKKDEYSLIGNIENDLYYLYDKEGITKYCINFNNIKNQYTHNTDDVALKGLNVKGGIHSINGGFYEDNKAVANFILENEAYTNKAYINKHLKIGYDVGLFNNDDNLNVPLSIQNNQYVNYNDSILRFYRGTTYADSAGLKNAYFSGVDICATKQGNEDINLNRWFMYRNHTHDYFNQQNPGPLQFGYTKNQRPNQSYGITMYYDIATNNYSVDINNPNINTNTNNRPSGNSAMAVYGNLDVYGDVNIIGSTNNYKKNGIIVSPTAIQQISTTSSGQLSDDHSDTTPINENDVVITGKNVAILPEQTLVVGHINPGFATYIKKLDSNYKTPLTVYQDSIIDASVCKFFSKSRANIELCLLNIAKENITPGSGKTNSIQFEISSEQNDSLTRFDINGYTKNEQTDMFRKLLTIYQSAGTNYFHIGENQGNILDTIGGDIGNIGLHIENSSKHLVYLTNNAVSPTITLHRHNPSINNNKVWTMEAPNDNGDFVIKHAESSTYIPNDSEYKKALVLTPNKLGINLDYPMHSMDVQGEFDRPVMRITNKYSDISVNNKYSKMFIVNSNLETSWVQSYYDNTERIYYTNLNYHIDKKYFPNRDIEQNYIPLDLIDSGNLVEYNTYTIEKTITVNRQFRKEFTQEYVDDLSIDDSELIINSSTIEVTYSSSNLLDSDTQTILTPTIFFEDSNIPWISDNNYNNYEHNIVNERNYESIKFELQNYFLLKRLSIHGEEVENIVFYKFFGIDDYNNYIELKYNEGYHSEITNNIKNIDPGKNLLFKKFELRIYGVINNNYVRIDSIKIYGEYITIQQEIEEYTTFHEISRDYKFFCEVIGPSTIMNKNLNMIYEVHPQSPNYENFTIDCVVDFLNPLPSGLNVQDRFNSPNFVNTRIHTSLFTDSFTDSNIGDLNLNITINDFFSLYDFTQQQNVQPIHVEIKTIGYQPHIILQNNIEFATGDNTSFGSVNKIYSRNGTFEITSENMTNKQPIVTITDTGYTNIYGGLDVNGYMNVVGDVKARDISFRNMTSDGDLFANRLFLAEKGDVYDHLGNSLTYDYYSNSFDRAFIMQSSNYILHTSNYSIHSYSNISFFLHSDNGVNIYKNSDTSSEYDLFKIYENDVSSFTITKGGNVGIQVENPEYDLHVRNSLFTPNIYANQFYGDGSAITGITTDQMAEGENKLFFTTLRVGEIVDASNVYTYNYIRTSSNDISRRVSILDNNLTNASNTLSTNITILSKSLDETSNNLNIQMTITSNNITNAITEFSEETSNQLFVVASKDIENKIISEFEILSTYINTLDTNVSNYVSDTSNFILSYINNTSNRIESNLHETSNKIESNLAKTSNVIIDFITVNNSNLHNLVDSLWYWSNINSMDVIIHKEINIYDENIVVNHPINKVNTSYAYYKFANTDTLIDDYADKNFHIVLKHNDGTIINDYTNYYLRDGEYNILKLTDAEAHVPLGIFNFYDVMRFSFLFRPLNSFSGNMFKVNNQNITIELRVDGQYIKLFVSGVDTNLKNELQIDLNNMNHISIDVYKLQGTSQRIVVNINNETYTYIYTYEIDDVHISDSDDFVIITPTSENTYFGSIYTSLSEPPEPPIQPNIFALEPQQWVSGSLFDNDTGKFIKTGTLDYEYIDFNFSDSTDSLYALTAIKIASYNINEHSNFEIYGVSDTNQKELIGTYPDDERNYTGEDDDGFYYIVCYMNSIKLYNRFQIRIHKIDVSTQQYNAQIQYIEFQISLGDTFETILGNMSSDGTLYISDFRISTENSVDIPETTTIVDDFYVETLDNNISNFAKKIDKRLSDTSNFLTNKVMFLDSTMSNYVGNLNADQISDGLSQNRFIVNDRYERPLTITGLLTASDVRIMGTYTTIETDTYNTENIHITARNDDISALIIEKDGNIKCPMVDIIYDDKNIVNIDSDGNLKAVAFHGDGSNIRNIYLKDKTTSELYEGSNLYFTSIRVGNIIDCSNIDTCNYIKRSSNELSQRITTTSNEIDRRFINTSNHSENRLQATSNILETRIRNTSNILRNNITNIYDRLNKFSYESSSNTMTFHDIDLGSNYISLTSNYSITSNWYVLTDTDVWSDSTVETQGSNLTHWFRCAGINMSYNYDSFSGNNNLYNKGVKNLLTLRIIPTNKGSGSENHIQPLSGTKDFSSGEVVNYKPEQYYAAINLNPPSSSDYIGIAFNNSLSSDPTSFSMTFKVKMSKDLEGKIPLCKIGETNNIKLFYSLTEKELQLILEKDDTADKGIIQLNPDSILDKWCCFTITYNYNNSVSDPETVIELYINYIDNQNIDKQKKLTKTVDGYYKPSNPDYNTTLLHDAGTTQNIFKGFIKDIRWYDLYVLTEDDITIIKDFDPVQEIDVLHLETSYFKEPYHYATEYYVNSTIESYVTTTFDFEGRITETSNKIEGSIVNTSNAIEGRISDTSNDIIGVINDTSYIINNRITSNDTNMSNYILNEKNIRDVYNGYVDNLIIANRDDGKILEPFTLKNGDYNRAYVFDNPDINYNFECSASIEAALLIVGGGGAGYTSTSSGAGAGGGVFVASNVVLLEQQNSTVKVGKGGSNVVDSSEPVDELLKIGENTQIFGINVYGGSNGYEDIGGSGTDNILNNLQNIIIDESFNSNLNIKKNDTESETFEATTFMESFASYFTLSDGNVYSCGRNENGQLGNGTKIDTKDTDDKMPTPVLLQSGEPMKDIIDIAGTSTYTIFVQKSGIAFASSNFLDQSTVNLALERQIPITRLFPVMENITQVACGQNHTVFLNEDKKAFSCGNNEFGQLGLRRTDTDRQFIPQEVPVPVLDDEGDVIKFARVACGDNHTIFITDIYDNEDIKRKTTAYGCGNNTNHQLGYIPETETSSGFLKPVMTNDDEPMENILYVDCGYGVSFFIVETGENETLTYACGNNYKYVLGNATTIPTNLAENKYPSILTSSTEETITNFQSVFCGKYYSIFMDFENYVYACGDNTYGQTGLSGTEIEHATKINDKKYSKVSCAQTHSIFCSETGNKVYMCGMNNYCQFGNGLEPDDFQVEADIVPKTFIEIENWNSSLLYGGGAFSLLGNGVPSNFIQNFFNIDEIILKYPRLSYPLGEGGLPKSDIRPYYNGYGHGGNSYGATDDNYNGSSGIIILLWKALRKVTVDAELYVNGNIYSSCNLYTNLDVYTTNVYATNDVYASYSDIRMKSIVGYIERPLESISHLNAFKYITSQLAHSYNFNNNNIQVGLSAQDVQNILPEAVSIAPFDMMVSSSGDIVSKSGSNFLTVSYERLVPLLIECIKEQKKEFDELKKLVYSKLL